MYKINYKELKYDYFKPQDSWSERFIVHIFSVPIAYLMLKLSQSKKLPYIVTISNFIINLMGAVLIYTGFYRIGAILWFCAFVMDNVDGVLSRFIFKEDPESRGVLDYTLDTLALFPILLVLFLVFLKKGAIAELILFFIFVELLAIIFCQSCTRVRLRGELKKRTIPLPSRKQIKEYIDKKSKFCNFFTDIYIKIEAYAKKFRVYPLPSIPDVHVFVYIMIPLLNFRYNIQFITLGIVIMILNILEAGIVNYILTQECMGKI